MEFNTDSGELFDNIVIVEDSNAEIKVSAKKVRSPKRTDLQLQMLMSFMEKHTDFTQGKADETQLLDWKTLVVELNLVGPPTHSSLGWRKNLTDYKASQKRNPTNCNMTV